MGGQVPSPPSSYKRFVFHILVKRKSTEPVFHKTQNFHVRLYFLQTGRAKTTERIVKKKVGLCRTGTIKDLCKETGNENTNRGH
jgi:hypothetical protein